VGGLGSALHVHFHVRTPKAREGQVARAFNTLSCCVAFLLTACTLAERAAAAPQGMCVLIEWGHLFVSRLIWRVGPCSLSRWLNGRYSGGCSSGTARAMARLITLRNQPPGHASSALALQVHLQCLCSSLTARLEIGCAQWLGSAAAPAMRQGVGRERTHNARVR
jgi:hypothetical protein